MKDYIWIHGQEYILQKLLGHGKGGYSYLAMKDGKPVVVKQIHHEPCDYYAFGNKIEAELRDYQRLKDAGIRIPLLLDYDKQEERIAKEYIEGDTIFHMVKHGEPVEDYLPQARHMAKLAQTAGLNIDYFPTNFVVQDDLLWYIDYECNDYMEEWSFENWGIQYWSLTPAFKRHLEKQETGS